MPDIIANKKNIVTGETYRITLLTGRMLRIEHQKDGCFEDRASQTVINRNFPEVKYSVSKEAEWIVIETEDIIVKYNGKEPTPYGLSAVMKSTGKNWNYGSVSDNLWGTARTLDEADGYVILQPGLFSQSGFAFHDDSASSLIGDDGDMIPRSFEENDIYIFAFGKDFLGGLNEFFDLCGKTPMIPRYALGNWWSRFHRYSEDSYMELVNRFSDEKIPLSVGVIDMDWHLTEVDPKYGSGWTGYTFNPDLFPNPQRFLGWLHEKGLYTTLNVHPADGIRAFESMYSDMAKKMGIDPATEEPIEFDMTDSAYRDAFFSCVNHMYEEMGVDFWWIDWQQGTKSKIKDLDPLWLLNHYYYEDMKAGGRRPMIFSRYAGVGSHRYPVGFSGDTFTTYKSLHFQPHFTLTSSNVGYGWWSHDICGHMHGQRNLDMLIRWLQFGVFSPIMRLHSSANPFFLKEPWNLPDNYRSKMGEWMRFRHRLIPYIYTMNYRAHKEGIPLIAPLYYVHPEEEAAYDVYNEYYFGSELLVSPITEAESDMLQMGSADTYLPDGRFYDIFTGKAYNGKLRHRMYRNIDSIPVFLPEGKILPLDLRGRDESHPVSNDTTNPEGIELLYGFGKNASFKLYEDDSLSLDYEKGICVTTKYQVEYDSEANSLKLIINPVEGDASLINEEREYLLTIYGVDASLVTLGDGVELISVDAGKHTATFGLGRVKACEGKCGVISGLKQHKTDFDEEIFDVLKNAKMDYDEKERIYYRLRNVNDIYMLNALLRDIPCDENLKNAIEEIWVGETD